MSINVERQEVATIDFVKEQDLPDINWLLDAYASPQVVHQLRAMLILRYQPPIADGRLVRIPGLPDSSGQCRLVEF